MWREDIEIFCGTEQACQGCPVTARLGEIYTAASVAYVLRTHNPEELTELSNNEEEVKKISSSAVGSVHCDDGEYWLNARTHREVTHEVAQAVTRISQGTCSVTFK